MPSLVISKGASRLFLSTSLLRSGRLAQREISLRFPIPQVPSQCSSQPASERQCYRSGGSATIRKSGGNLATNRDARPARTGHPGDWCRRGKMGECVYVRCRIFHLPFLRRTGIFVSSETSLRRCGREGTLERVPSSAVQIAAGFDQPWQREGTCYLAVWLRSLRVPSGSY